MLRYDFLPSDYHPMMLLLGEQEDLSRLADGLSDFAAQLQPVYLDTLVKVHPSMQLRIELRPDLPGLRHGTEPDCFVWGLTPDLANAFAGQMRTLSQLDMMAGSEQVETGVAGEIPVEVSRGEFTDDCLVGTH